jgi:hypothetical protein
MENKLAEIQAKVKAPKGQFNSFGKYNYRSAEDILEAVKQVVNPMGYSITISDTIINVGDRYYIKATATLTNGKETWSTDGYAREEESKKGMDGSQVTGASSSYARKYALNGLFALDDTKDSDATNTHGKEAIEQPRGFKSYPTQIPSVSMNLDELETFEYLIKECNDINTLELLWGKVEPKYKGNSKLIELFSNRKKQIIK